MSDLISKKALVKAILAERDKHPLEVEERYGFGVKVPCRFNQALRGGIRKCLHLVETAPTIDVHAHWELRYENIENDDGWTHNRCSHCKHDAVFYSTFSEDWDEDIDGEWISLGVVEDGIEEILTDYCPYCGAKMDEGVSV